MKMETNFINNIFFKKIMFVFSGKSINTVNSVTKKKFLNFHELTSYVESFIFHSDFIVPLNAKHIYEKTVNDKIHFNFDRFESSHYFELYP